jgi:hypothetical protein
LGFDNSIQRENNVINFSESIVCGEFGQGLKINDLLALAPKREPVSVNYLSHSLLTVVYAVLFSKLAKLLCSLKLKIQHFFSFETHRG